MLLVFFGMRILGEPLETLWWQLPLHVKGDWAVWARQLDGYKAAHIRAILRDGKVLSSMLAFSRGPGPSGAANTSHAAAAGCRGLGASTSSAQMPGV